MSTGSGETPRAELVTTLDTEIRRMVARTVLFQQAIAERAGMSATELHCLNLLMMSGPMTTGQLAEETGLTRGGAITTVIDGLEKYGYLRRERDPQDRRRVLLHVRSDKANRDMGHLYSSIGHRSAEIMENYTDDELATILDYVTRANQLSYDETRRLREQVPRPNSRRRTS